MMQWYTCMTYHLRLFVLKKLIFVLCFAVQESYQYVMVDISIKTTFYCGVAIGQNTYVAILKNLR